MATAGQPEVIALGVLALAGVAVFLVRPEASPAPATSGVDGFASQGPTCPVTPVPPLPDVCAPRPVASAPVSAEQGGVVVAAVRTAADGSYVIGLAPGVYTITAGHVGTTFPVPPPPVLVTVMAGVFTPVDLLYDTGIR